jgi:hypothetical protein
LTVFFKRRRKAGCSLVVGVVALASFHDLFYVGLIKWCFEIYENDFVSGTVWRSRGVLEQDCARDGPRITTYLLSSQERTNEQHRT